MISECSGDLYNVDDLRVSLKGYWLIYWTAIWRIKIYPNKERSVWSELHFGTHKNKYIYFWTTVLDLIDLLTLNITINSAIMLSTIHNRTTTWIEWLSRSSSNYEDRGELQTLVITWWPESQALTTLATCRYKWLFTYLACSCLHGDSCSGLVDSRLIMTASSNKLSTYSNLHAFYSSVAG